MVQKRPILLLIVALAGFIAFLGVKVAFSAVAAAPKQWIALSFGLVMLLAAAFLLMLGLGRIRQGPAITLLCVAGATAVGGVFSYISTGKPPSTIKGDWATLASMAVAGLLVAVASLDVLMRRPGESWPRLIRGVLIALPLLALLFLLARGTITGVLSKTNMGVEFAGYVLLLLVGIALAAAAGHQIITAFQIGVTAMDEASDAEAGQGVKQAG